MDDKDRMYSVGKSEIFLKPINAPDSEYKKLDVVEGSVSLESEEKPWKPKPLSFTATVESAEAFEKLVYSHPDVQKIMQRAQNMLDHIKEQMDLFYNKKQPLNRRERRQRAKELEKKINRFKAYCKEHGIEIKNNP